MTSVELKNLLQDLAASGDGRVDVDEQQLIARIRARRRRRGALTAAVAASTVVVVAAGAYAVRPNDGIDRPPVAVTPTAKAAPAPRFGELCGKPFTAKLPASVPVAAHRAEQGTGETASPALRVGEHPADQHLGQPDRSHQRDRRLGNPREGRCGGCGDAGNEPGGSRDEVGSREERGLHRGHSACRLPHDQGWRRSVDRAFDRARHLPALRATGSDRPRSIGPRACHHSPMDHGGERSLVGRAGVAPSGVCRIVGQLLADSTFRNPVARADLRGRIPTAPGRLPCLPYDVPARS